jgi:DNA-binding transcriptional LysR family regulator
MSYLLKDLTSSLEHLELTLVNPEEECDARIINAADLVEGEAFQPLWLDRFFLALPRGHELSLKEQVSITDLDGLPFINRSPCAALDLLKQALHAAGLGLTSRANIRTVEYALGMVSAGVGAALVPDWESTLSRKDIVLRRFSDIMLEQRIGLAYPQQAISPILSLTVDLCRQRWSAENPE